MSHTRRASFPEAFSQSTRKSSTTKSLILFFFFISFVSDFSQAALFAQGAPPITDHFHDRQRRSLTFFFCYFRSRGRRDRKVTTRRFCNLRALFDSLFGFDCSRSCSLFFFFFFFCLLLSISRKILLRTPGAAAVLSPTATYGRHHCPYFCARRFDELSISVRSFFSYPL